MGDLTNTFVATGGALVVFAGMQWLASLRLRDVSIVDRFWGIGFLLVAVTGLVLNGQYTARAALLLAMVALWGTRLSLYIAWRNWGAGEDYRYQAMRRRFGSRFAWSSLFVVFGLQGALTWFISLPLQVVMARNGAPLNALDAAGLLLWSAGMAFETVGDWQLARFKSDPRNAGRALNTGLWRYTRHPNYFGDALVWWGHFVVSLSAPGAVYAVAGPIVMTYLLLRVSGVTLLEPHLRKTKKGYEEYVQNTSAFVPWFPRKGATAPGQET